MAISIKSELIQEFESKRRKAQREAQIYKATVYEKYPALFELEKNIRNTATEYTKKIINGDADENEMKAALEALSKEKDALFESYNLDKNEFEPQYECKKCNDTGYIGNEMCSCFKKRLIEENFRNSNIGETLSHQTFENFEFKYYSSEKTDNRPLSPLENMKHNFAVCKTFAEKFDEISKSLLLIGATGLGKTYLSTCVANKLLSAGKSVVYISAVDFFKRIEKSRFDSANTDTLLFESCDLLIIDDIGTEAPSVYTTAVFSDILDKRIRLGKKMILSSNTRFSDFEKIYGERVFSRLAGCFECLLFYGKDIRIQKFLNGGN